MSQAIKDLKDFLTKSPSGVFPDEVLELLEPIEEENKKLLAERNYLFMNSNPTACELRRVRAEWKRDREENAKLREVATRMKDNLLFSCSECWLGDDVKTCGNNECGNRKTYKTLCELGIEVE